MLKKLLLNLNPYSIGIAICIASLVLFFIVMQYAEIADLKNKITAEELATKHEKLETLKWKLAHTNLSKQTRDQNQAIEALEAAHKATKERLLQANKKAEVIVRHRQDQKNAAENRPNPATTCDEAVQQAQNELKAGQL
jgi:reverse gyrase